MFCVCYVCGIQYRVKPPFANRCITHGLCGECLPKEIERLMGEVPGSRKDCRDRRVEQRWIGQSARPDSAKGYRIFLYEHPVNERLAHR